ncbi:RNA polymerase sigma factor [Acidicapsa dinghuensis]|uniref:RNA polymerase sigma factor n=1 Tax=Acidicapsa dinghuensis TaxID=2218256 RepID=A0ABW1ECP6_9BACT|nr:sigma-70 family RNA polymerase sigma factor [Acidicapsa dinghuensis]
MDGEVTDSCSNLEISHGEPKRSVVAPHQIRSDDALLAEVQSGSKEALGLLFRRYRPPVVHIARRILRDASEAEDLCQEVFVYLFEKAKLFDPSKGSASTWIIQIAYHRAMNRRAYLAHRQHYTAQEFDEQRFGPSPRSSIDELTARNLLNRLRGQLTQDQRQTLELHFFEGYSLKEIAERTHQKLGNVRHHFYRGLERLRSNLFPPNTSE